MKRWTKEDDNILLENYENGIEYCSIILKRTKKSISHRLKNLNLIEDRKWTDDEINILRELYEKNGVSYISSLLKRSKRAIATKASELGLKVDSDVKSNIISKYKLLNHKKFEEFKVNPNNFINNITPESAYVLGYLWADGYLRNDVISMWIKKDDAECIKSVFDNTGVWNNYYRFKKSKNRKEQMCFLTNNRFLYQFLVNNDYKQKSVSAPNKILSIIPDSIKHYFFRGYFDGDGSIYRYKLHNSVGLNICSTYEQNWDFIIELFSKLSINLKIKKTKYLSKNNKEYKMSRVIIYNKLDIIKFCNYIYKDYKLDGIGLNRKYRIYEEIVSG